MQKVCFIHIPKSGGTSVQHWLRSHYSESSVPDNPDDFLSHRSRYLSTPLIYGHIRFSDIKDISGIAFLTMLRKPESLYMSLLWNQLQNKQDGKITGLHEHKPYIYSDRLAELAKDYPNHPLVLGRFIDEFEREPFPGRTVKFSSKFATVGITEYFEDSLRLFAWKLGLKAPKEIGHYRQTGAGDAGMPAEIKKILSEYLHWDSLLYDEGRRRFDRDFAELVDIAGSVAAIDDYLDQTALIHNTAKSS